MRNYHARGRLLATLLGTLIVLLGTGSSLPTPAAPPDTGQAPNSWEAMGMAGAPSPRSWATTVWTGREFIRWGGYHGTTYRLPGATP